MLRNQEFFNGLLTFRGAVGHIGVCQGPPPLSAVHRSTVRKRTDGSMRRLHARAATFKAGSDEYYREDTKHGRRRASVVLEVRPRFMGASIVAAREYHAVVCDPMDLDGMERPLALVLWLDAPAGIACCCNVRASIRHPTRMRS
jgi:hypothetical protein